MVESINARLRKATRNRGYSPPRPAALRVLHLAVREQIAPRTRDPNHVAAHWKEALDQFSLFYEERLDIRWLHGTYPRFLTHPPTSGPGEAMIRAHLINDPRTAR
ncbi:hypothetical protein ABIA38_003440 [Embleya sp. AB8]